jgi:3-(3-hydroxy-phenyl)propionate hydroxylase
MEEKDPVARVRNFDELAATAADPVAHRAYLLRASLLDSVRNNAQVAA